MEATYEGPGRGEPGMTEMEERKGPRAEPGSLPMLAYLTCLLSSKPLCPHLLPLAEDAI